MKKRILVVDDEPDLCSLVSSLLKDAGFETICAMDGKDCLKKLQKEGKFDLILLDIMMPGLTPKEIISGIKNTAKCKDTKISYLSVVEFPEDEKKALFKEKNVIDYIQKPFDNAELVRRVKKMLKA